MKNESDQNQPNENTYSFRSNIFSSKKEKDKISEVVKMDKISSEKYYKEEYKSIKMDQSNRIKSRDYMIYLTLAAIGTVIFYGIKSGDYNISLLFLPLFCTMMGWIYFANDRRISKISEYIDDYLVPNLYTWEKYKKDDPERLNRKFIQLVMDLLLFCGPSIFAIVQYLISNGFDNDFYLFIIFGETFLMSILFVSFIKSWWKHGKFR